MPSKRQPKRSATTPPTSAVARRDDAALQRVTRLATLALRTPVAAVSIVQGAQETFPAVVGSPPPPTSLPPSRSLAIHVIDAGEPVVFDDVREAGEASLAAAALELGWTAFAGAPIRAGDDGPLGMLAVADTVPRDWSPEDILILSELAGLVSADLAHRRRADADARSASALRRLSLIDDATGLYNRRAFVMLARQQFKLAHRMGRDLLFVFVNIEASGPVRETRVTPHTAATLKAVATCMQETFRESDIIARIGPSEFAALALEGERTGDDVMTARVQRALEELPSLGPESRRSVSVGSARYDPRRPSSILELLMRADAQLGDRRRRRQQATQLDSGPRGGDT